MPACHIPSSASLTWPVCLCSLMPCLSYDLEYFAPLSDVTPSLGLTNSVNLVLVRVT
jgi:hypothetical protein